MQPARLDEPAETYAQDPLEAGNGRFLLILVYGRWYCWRQVERQERWEGVAVVLAWDGDVHDVAVLGPVEKLPNLLNGPPTQGHEQVGCIYTAQGMEYTYNVVIIGKDLVRRDDKWVAHPDKSFDPAFKNILPDRYLRYALNSYRVLATRGTRGTRLYSTDLETQAHLETLLPQHDRRPGQG